MGNWSSMCWQAVVLDSTILILTIIGLLRYDLLSRSMWTKVCNQGVFYCITTLIVNIPMLVCIPIALSRFAIPNTCVLLDFCLVESESWVFAYFLFPHPHTTLAVMSIMFSTPGKLPLMVSRHLTYGCQLQRWGMSMHISSCFHVWQYSL